MEIDFSLKKFGTIFISQLDKVPDDIFDPEHMQKARLNVKKLICSRFEPESTVCTPRTIPLSYNQAYHNLNFAYHTPLLILRSTFLCTILCVEISFIKINCSIAE